MLPTHKCFKRTCCLAQGGVDRLIEDFYLLSLLDCCTQIVFEFAALAKKLGHMTAKNCIRVFAGRFRMIERNIGLPGKLYRIAAALR
ncbi:hypothetical protein D3C73_1284880 [compost metagenome]